MGNFILCLRQCPQRNSIKCSTLTENFSLLLSSTYFEVSNVGYLFENLFQKGHFLIGLYCSHLNPIDSDLRMFLWFICLSISRLEIDHQALRESFACRMLLYFMVCFCSRKEAHNCHHESLYSCGSCSLSPLGHCG